MWQYHTSVEREIMNVKKDYISLKNEDAISELSSWYSTEIVMMITIQWYFPKYDPGYAPTQTVFWAIKTP